MSSIDLSQQCNLCRAKIPVGVKYGVLTFQIETLDQTVSNPNGVVTVHHSEIATTMCFSCASKYDSESVKTLID